MQLLNYPSGQFASPNIVGRHVAFFWVDAQWSNRSPFSKELFLTSLTINANICDKVLYKIILFHSTLSPKGSKRIDLYPAVKTDP